VNGHRRKRIYGSHWQRRVRPRILIRDRGKPCPICGGRVAPWEASVDHITPLEAGGSPFDERNLQVVHAKCNSSKGGGPGHRGREKWKPGVRKVWPGAIDLG
jgi:5-methylcytosine-specific restriction endonuclease McrA